MDKFWLASYPEGMPEFIDLDKKRTLVNLLEDCCEKYKAGPAFKNMGVVISFSDLNLLTEQLAGYFQQVLGLKKGDRLAIMMPNLLQYPVIMFAALRAGLVVVNVNPMYTPRELIHQLKDASVSAIFVLDLFASTLQKALEEVTVKHVVVSKVGDMLGFMKGKVVDFVLKYIKKTVPNFTITQAISFSDVLQKSKKTQFKKPGMDGSDLAFLQYTGGTTGVAKGAMLTHANMLANVLQCYEWVNRIFEDGKEIVVTALPLYHIYSLTVCCMTFMRMGGCGLLITNPRDRGAFIETLAKEKFTAFVGLNTLFQALAEDKRFQQLDFSALKLTVAGGMATQQVVADLWQEVTGCVVLEGYGLTEASPVVCMNPVTQKRFRGVSGLAFPSTLVCVRDKEGNDLPAGQPGELCIKGPQVMKGYWQREEATQEAVVDGWLYTGDIATINKEGRIKIVDRVKDMIIVSGFNVYPNEVEDVIASHPGVHEVAVIGAPHPKNGEMVKAFVVKEDDSLTEEQLKSFFRDKLTAYKVPKRIEFIDSLPKSNVGKVLRKELR